MYEHELPPADAEADELIKDKEGEWTTPVPVLFSAKKEAAPVESLMSITEKICCGSSD
jgi:hypothetical protein